MNYFFTFLFFVHTINFITLYGAAAAAAMPESKSQAEQVSTMNVGDFALKAPAARQALYNTGITEALHSIIFSFLRTQFTKRFAFDGISHKLAVTANENGFYGIDHANSLNHYDCLGGGTTPLYTIDEQFRPLRNMPIKSWITVNHLLVIGRYKPTSKTESWYIRSTNLNHPHHTCSLKLNSDCDPVKPRPTPAAILAAGIVIGSTRFALHNPCTLQKIQQFNNPPDGYNTYRFKAINGNQFIGQFKYPSPTDTPDGPFCADNFCHYIATQAAPLHSFFTGCPSPRIFPCHDQNTLIMADDDGHIEQYTFEGPLRRCYTPYWGGGAANIALNKDGQSFIAHGKNKIIRLSIDNPHIPLPIVRSAKMPGKLKQISPTDFVSEGPTTGCDLVLLSLAPPSTTILSRSGAGKRISPIKLGFANHSPIESQVEVWSARSLFELACLSGGAPAKLPHPCSATPPLLARVADSLSHRDERLGAAAAAAATVASSHRS